MPADVKRAGSICLLCFVAPRVSSAHLALDRQPHLLPAGAGCGTRRKHLGTVLAQPRPAVPQAAAVWYIGAETAVCV